MYGYERLEHSLESRGLAKSFIIDGREHPVFGGVDLSIEHNEFVAIVGESRVGQDDALAIITGLEAADSGSVAVGGKPVGVPAPSAAWSFRRLAFCRG